jgi:hypothetical protein
MKKADARAIASLLKLAGFQPYLVVDGRDEWTLTGEDGFEVYTKVSAGVIKVTQDGRQVLFTAYSGAESFIISMGAALRLLY